MHIRTEPTDVPMQRARLEFESVPPLAERVGGRWAISLVGYLVISASIILAVFTAERDATRSVSDMSDWTIVAISVVLGLGLYLLVLDRFTSLRDRSVRTISRPVLLLTLAGGMAVVTIVRRVAIALTGATSVIGPLEFELLVFGAWFWVGLILFLDQVDRARRNRALLVDHEVRLELANLQQMILLEGMRRDLYEEIDAELDPTRVALEARITELDKQSDTSAGSDVPELIRTIADGAIRPLSRRLWTEPPSAAPAVKWRTIVSETIRSEPFRPAALVLIHVLGTVSTNALLYGPNVAALMALAVSAFVLLVTLPVNVLMRLRPSQHQLLFIAASLFLQLNVIPMAIWRSSLSASTGSVSWMITQVVAGLTLILITSGFGSWKRMRLAVDSSHLESIDADLVTAIARSRAAAELAQEISRELHGTVQTKLVACAMAGDHAVRSADLQQLRVALLEAQRVLDARFELVNDHRSTRAEIEHKVGLWEGLCSINFAIDPIVELRSFGDDRAARTVGRVVEEGISNAIRHGDAGHIDIGIEMTDDGGIRIIITDDGRGPTGNRPGIGTAFLEQATQGRWSLETHAPGTRLVAVVSLSPAAAGTDSPAS